MGVLRNILSGILDILSMGCLNGSSFSEIEDLNLYLVLDIGQILLLS